MKSELPNGMNYAVFNFAALLPWTFFATALSLGGQSLVNQQQLLTKIYFPRLFVPTSVVGGALVDMAISYLVMALIMAWYGVMPTWSVFALIPLMIPICLAALGVAYAFSALTMTYRDFRFVLPFMVQAWMYLSPVIYPASFIPARYQWIASINPMYGVIDGFRSALLGRYQGWNFENLSISIASSVVIFIYGLFYFRKSERRFADVA
jgi:lipopolysaccharide transport system permease protein